MMIPMVTHASIAIVSFYLFILFSTWWIITRHATAIFGFTCFLMFGLSVHYGITAYMWWLEANNLDSIKFAQETPLLIYNCSLILIPLIFYAYHVSIKFFKAIFINKSKHIMEEP